MIIIIKKNKKKLLYHSASAVLHECKGVVRADQRSIGRAHHKRSLIRSLFARRAETIIIRSRLCPSIRYKRMTEPSSSKHNKQYK